MRRVVYTTVVRPDPRGMIVLVLVGWVATGLARRREASGRRAWATGATPRADATARRRPGRLSPAPARRSPRSRRLHAGASPARLVLRRQGGQAVSGKTKWRKHDRSSACCACGRPLVAVSACRRCRPSTLPCLPGHVDPQAFDRARRPWRRHVHGRLDLKQRRSHGELRTDETLIADCARQSRDRGRRDQRDIRRHAAKRLRHEVRPEARRGPSQGKSDARIERPDSRPGDAGRRPREEIGRLR